ncbi:MAG: hypothetical protein KC505_09140 [Myxococcales bacterium]|nr:hypothetical protein [Myxococcales bacterium]USN51639.1 MAG: hypothetical protein H6731_04305 [Myxococcales bacterium]
MGVAPKKIQDNFVAMLTKEELRQKRKEAYQKAKAKRDADPQFQALKEKMKEARKEKYRAHRDKIKKAKEEEKQKKRAEKDASLMVFFKSDSELEKKKT